MEFSKVYLEICSEVLSQDLEKNEVCLFNTKTNKGYMIDGLSCLIITNNDSQKSLQENLKNLELKYEIDFQKFTNEIINLINDLRQKELIKINEK